METGFVYIITTKLYEPLDIFKIGCTKNMDQRLKGMNATRTLFDKFYVVNTIKTFHYFKLEQGLHKILEKYRLNNEFFQCTIETIDEAIHKYVEENVFLLHDDKIVKDAEERHLKWFSEKNMFSTNFNGIEIFFNETRFIDELKQWISIFDMHNLYRFLHDSHFYRIIAHLKSQFEVSDKSVDITNEVSGTDTSSPYEISSLWEEDDISIELNKLFISTPPTDLNHAMEQLNL